MDEADLVRRQALRLFLYDIAAVEEWIATPMALFDGRSPLEHIEHGGYGDVVDLLGRIEHGVFS